MLLFVYGVTITLSAFLLFLIQPMITKIIMPYLGGAPAVWNTAMVLFQALLLVGYGYAHVSAKYLTPRRQAFIHIVIVLVSLALLPLSLHMPDSVDSTYQPVAWVLAALAMSVGLHFFLLSASAPLLQRWFALSGHPHAANPYRLYAASNIGSFAALLLFPVVFETLWPSSMQLIQWSWLFGLYAGLLLACLLLVYKNLPAVRADADVGDHVAPSWRTRMLWTVLAAVPSSLMLGVTTYITTDIASVPLLWIIPLGLYLLSFVFAFGNAGRLYRLCYSLYLPSIVLLLLFWIFGGAKMWMFLLNLTGFFVLAMACHGRLNQLKPPAAHLTQFYLCLSLGGVLGGAFNALLAPVLFAGAYEYGLVLLLAAALYPGFRTNIKPVSISLFNVFVFGVLAYLLIRIWGVLQAHPINEALSFGSDFNVLGIILGLWMLGYALYQVRHARVPFIALFVVMFVYEQCIMRPDTAFQERNFFGVSRVSHVAEMDLTGYFHGTTLHGVQSTDPDKNRMPLSYYWPLKQLFDTQTLVREHPYAVLGLGVATVQCYAAETQQVDYFEIDPLVEAIARNKDYFTYLSDCPGTHQIVLGDGRLQLANQPDQRYGLVILDAYSSDSLPIHLMTKEAVAMYQSKLVPGGLLAFNITNRHMDLKPILGNIAAALKLQAVHQSFVPPETDENGRPSPLLKADWIVLSDDKTKIESLRQAGWKRVRGSSRHAWSDDYSNILEALILTKYWFLNHSAPAKRHVD